MELTPFENWNSRSPRTLASSAAMLFATCPFGIEGVILTAITQPDSCHSATGMAAGLLQVSVPIPPDVTLSDAVPSC